MSDFYVSTDKSILDIELIVHFLNNDSYWAKTRSKEVIEKSINNSLCFGVFDKDNHQVGFARVITDFSVFAWLLDVFIIKECRGKGLGKQLLKEIMCHEDLQGIKRWGLGTKNAHGLYKQFGFTHLTSPEMMMEKITLEI